MKNYKFFFSLLSLAFLLLLPFGQLFAKTKKPIEFVVVIPSYNNEKWCEKNLESIFKQTYPHWSIIYLNDCSTDNTSKLVENYFRDHDPDGRCTLINNDYNMGAMANYYQGIMLCDPDKVVATLDGDDWLANNKVLAKLAKIYGDKKVWVTHGDFITEPYTVNSFCKAYPKKVMKNNEIRKHEWLGGQLRTFYAKLFHQIDINDLMWEGDFVPMTSDLAFMFPILEMASQGHVHYVEDIFYIVNTDNPISDHKRNIQLQLDIDQHLRSLPPYKPLKKLF